MNGTVTQTGGLTITAAMVSQVIQWAASSAAHVVVPDTVAMTMAAALMTGVHALIVYRKPAAPVAPTPIAPQ